MSLDGPAGLVPEPDVPFIGTRRRAFATRRRLAGAATVIVFVAAAVFAADGGRFPGPGPGGTPTATASSPGQPSPQPSASAPEPEEAWSDLELAPLKPVATIVASNVDRIGVARSSSFRLTSLTGIEATTLAKGVTAVPNVAFTVKAGPDRATAILVPKAPLTEGTSYRLTLRTPDSALGGSWLFQTESPLHVESTLPGDEATEVPTNTGIEVAFDQDGIGPIAPFFSIDPKVAGSFQERGRTWVFVPARPLAAGTIYSVTIRKGVTVSGSDQVLGRDVRFSFETLAPGQQPNRGEPGPLDASFPKVMTEAVPGEPPVVEVYVDRPWDSTDTRKGLTALDLRVYRLSSLPSAIAAYRTLSAAPAWAQTSDQGLVSTGGLPLVASFTAIIHAIGQGESDAGISYVDFPGPLDRGWYLLVRPRTGARDQQVVLQVTDVATYVTTTTTRSVLWVNDVTTGGPVAGAKLWTAAGREIATTAADGTATPIMPDGTLFVVAAPDAGAFGAAAKPGRAAVLPLAVEAKSSDRCDWGWGTTAETYWSVLATDRTVFRPTDEIDAWGMVRPRDGGTAANVELRLSVDRWQCDETPAENRALAIARAAVTPGGTTGTFATSLPLRNVPAGWYRLDLWAGDDRVASHSVQVGEIRKPSYTFSITTDRHVLVDGDNLTAKVASQFFDGTPLPALDVRLDGPDVGERRATTSGDGELAVNLATSWKEQSRAGWTNREVSVSPAMPEEAEIPNKSAGYVVFPSRLLLEGKAVVDGPTIRIEGAAHALDQGAAERQWIASAGLAWDPKGAPSGGTKVGIEVVDTWWVPVKTGRSYDFISKLAYDTYRYDRKERVLARTTVVAGSDGTFRLSVPRTSGDEAPPKGHDYKVTLSGRDSDGHAVTAERYAYASWNEIAERGEGGPPWAQLEFANEPESTVYKVGDEIQRMLTWRGSEPPTGDANRYLFFTALAGLHDVTVSPSPTFLHTFSVRDIPNISIGAVWFTGRHYLVTSGAGAEFDRDARKLEVTLTPDRARHAPGDPVRLAIRTATAEGAPVAATVVLRAIDEKLYAINAAWPEDALEQAYTWVSSGVRLTYASHTVPAGRPMNGGADVGGGCCGDVSPVRQDFRDSVLFQKVTTGANGQGSVTFTLSDDITSWRVSGTAFTADLRIGQSSAAIAAGLPFFIEAPLAPEYLASDRPTLLVRAYGTALSARQAVSFTVSAPTLQMTPTTVGGPAYTQVEVPLPALTPGEHEIRIEARSGSGAASVADTLVRTIRVVDTRFTKRQSASVVLPAPLPPAGGAGMATYVFADAGRGKYMGALQRLAWSGGDRVDQALATLVARDVLRQAFAIDEFPDGGVPTSLTRYQKEPPQSKEGNNGAGVALLPYGSPDLALSARAALLAADRFDTARLAWYFSRFRDSQAAATREQENIALAGLAGLPGYDYLVPDVVAALDDPALTLREQLYLALAAARLGDHATALRVERRMLDAFGQRLGQWVRLRVSLSPGGVVSGEATLEATSLLALVAVTVGDPVAESLEAYVEDHSSAEDLYQLQQAAFLREAVSWTPAAAARFSYTIGGGTQVVDLAPGESSTMRLTPAQRSTLVARTVTGRISVAVSWDEPVDAASMETDPSLSIVRTVTPSSPVPAGSVVKVVLTPRFGELTIAGCYRVVDLAPSGLRPMAWTYGASAGSDDVTPWVIAGQRVTFCTAPGSSRPQRLVYYARVVTPGDYTWEPAIMQAARATESAALTPTRTITLE